MQLTEALAKDLEYKTNDNSNNFAMAGMVIGIFLMAWGVYNIYKLPDAGNRVNNFGALCAARVNGFFARRDASRTLQTLSDQSNFLPNQAEVPILKLQNDNDVNVIDIPSAAEPDTSSLISKTI
ncbi:MAG: hypothetical protein WBE18_03555 [Gammaproteobacteria bacterium]